MSMKKLLACLLALMMALALVACGGDTAAGYQRQRHHQCQQAGQKLLHAHFIILQIFNTLLSI